jgi:hypothetical protein
MSDHLKLAPVSVLPVVTTLDVDVERILRAAIDQELTQVIIIGYTPDGELYFASSKSDGGSVLWDMEIAKRALMGAS